MIKPEKLHKGDTIAVVSPSWGICGDKKALPKYKLAVEYFEKEFDINGILSTIGGNDSINILPFIDLNVIKNNPKIFIGSSDIFNIHALFLNAGVVSFYGGNLLTSLTNSIECNSYSSCWLKKAIFSNEIIGKMMPPKEYSYNKKDIFSENLEYTFYRNGNYKVINGKGIVSGKLIICTTELKTIQESEFKISEDIFSNTILCLDDIAECVSPQEVFDFIIWLYEQNILHNINALVIAKFDEYPQNFLYEEVVVKALNKLSM